MAKFVCPYCLQDCNLKEVLFACNSCGQIHPDMRMFERHPKCQNEGCPGLVTIRLCPKCEHRIPTTALETPNLPFSIVGVPGAGKTNYITVMLQELRNESALQLALSHQDKDTMEHQDELYQMIYEDLTPPPPTEAGERMPQIWSIKNLQRKAKNSVPTYTFTIFDGAGEDHENEIDPTSAVARYINISKAIIFVLDPLTLSSIRRGGIVDQKVMRDSLVGGEGDTKMAGNIISDVANYIRTMNPKLKATSVLNLPVAVVLTKFDTVWNHPSFGPDARIKHPKLTINGGKISMSEIDQVHAEIEHWLHAIGEGALINIMDANFKEYKLFGVSSYGSPPKDASTLNRPDPHRVLDPLLWMFKKQKFID